MEGKYGIVVAEIGIYAMIMRSLLDLARLEESMVTRSTSVWCMATLVLSLFSACQRDAPAEKASSQPPGPAGSVEQAVQQTVEGIKGPMDKARGVEGTLSQAAERTGEQTSQATP